MIGELLEEKIYPFPECLVIGSWTMSPRRNSEAFSHDEQLLIRSSTGLHICLT